VILIDGNRSRCRRYLSAACKIHLKGNYNRPMPQLGVVGVVRSINGAVGEADAVDCEAGRFDRSAKFKIGSMRRRWLVAGEKMRCGNRPPFVKSVEKVAAIGGKAWVGRDGEG
jgi:hypothetical protein